MRRAIQITYFIMAPVEVTPLVQSGTLQIMKKVVFFNETNVLNNTSQNEKYPVSSASDSTKIILYILNNALEKVLSFFHKKEANITVNERKALRQEKVKQKHCLKISCRKTCQIKITCERRTNINRQFCGMTIKDKNTFMFHHNQKLPTKKKQFWRNHAEYNKLKYFLEDRNGTSQEVYKMLFFSTLGYGKHMFCELYWKIQT